jgi:hypothetical protein
VKNHFSVLRKKSLLTSLAAAVAVLMLAPLSSASAMAISPPGNVRNAALRDTCGGANTNISWGGATVSTWGIVWDTANCPNGDIQNLYLVYGDSVNPVYDDTWAINTGAPYGIGYNSGTLTFPAGITYVAEQVCASNCSTLQVFAG